jgi:addiction module RelE/StbE family toxin
MGQYDVRYTDRFDRHLRTARKRFALDNAGYLELVDELNEVKNWFENNGHTLNFYQAHELKGSPWRGFFELHVMADVLLVYTRDEAHGVIRFVGLYTHERLHGGRVD